MFGLTMAQYLKKINLVFISNGKIMSKKVIKKYKVTHTILKWKFLHQY